MKKYKTGTKKYNTAKTLFAIVCVVVIWRNFTNPISMESPLNEKAPKNNQKIDGKTFINGTNIKNETAINNMSANPSNFAPNKLFAPRTRLAIGPSTASVAPANIYNIIGIHAKGFRKNGINDKLSAIREPLSIFGKILNLDDIVVQLLFWIPRFNITQKNNTSQAVLFKQAIQTGFGRKYHFEL